MTIATTMAGRGTDIILGGTPEGLTKLALMRLVYRRLLKGASSCMGGKGGGGGSAGVGDAGVLAVCWVGLSSLASKEPTLP